MSALPQPAAPTRFLSIIPCDIRDRLVPQHSEAFGLYTQLADAVTCGVPYGEKKFGLVLGGTSMSQLEWASRFRMTKRSFQRAIAILKTEDLVVVHRGQHDTKIAITDSVKKTLRRGTVDRYPWLLNPDVPNMAQLEGGSDVPNMAQQRANMAQLRAKMAQLDSSKNPQVAGDGVSCKDCDGREEVVEEEVERGVEATANPSLLFSPNPTPTPKPTPSLEDVADLCAKLYSIGHTHNPCHSTVPRKYRPEIGRLLSIYSPDELCEGYQEFVRHLDDFEMRHAPQHFVEGGADDVIAPIRKRKAEREALRAKWRQEQIDRHRQDLESEILDSQEQCGGKEPPSSSLHRRWELAQRIDGKRNTSDRSHTFQEFIELQTLRAEARKAADLQEAVNKRLAAEPPFDPGICTLGDMALRQQFGS